MLDALIAVVIAPPCASCGELLERPADGPVCNACWRSIRRFSPPLCDTCGDPVPPVGSRLQPPQARQTEAHAAPGGVRCPWCRRASRAVTRARAIGAYERHLRDIIHAFKYERRPTLAGRLGALMQESGADVLDGADVVVPVPLHWRRRRHRGFNQAALLARELDLPVRNVLRRRRPTRPQIDLPADARHANVAGAFALAWRYRLGAWPLPGARPLFGRPLSGAVVVLVDDVSTTGATLEACARVLLAAGAAEVRALTAARVVSPRR